MADGHKAGNGAGVRQPQRSRVSQVESRVIFEREMGHTARPVQYDRTSALLLGWCPELDDTGVADELIDLEKVLKERYNFNVQKELLHREPHPQKQAFKHLATFVEAEDKSRSLLIVYYAGHGWSEAAGTGKISLSGRLPCSEKEEELFSIKWAEVERTLAATLGDVLVIFDCCNAGLICRKATRGRNRCYQYLGACETTQSTSVAGPESFTHAMTWALNELAMKPGFALTELVNRIQSCPTFPQAQTPCLFLGRFEESSEIIHILPTPVPKVTGPDAPPSPPASKSTSPSLRPSDGPETQDVLDLRFHFEQPATEDDIKEVARAMRRILAEWNPPYHRVSFLDRHSIARRVAEKWKGTLKRKEMTGNLQLNDQLLSVAATATEMAKRLQLPKLDTTASGPSTTLTTGVDTPAQLDEAL